MKLLLPSTDDLTGDATPTALSQDLQRWAGDYYVVSPVDSYTAYETFEFGDGSRRKVSSQTFIVVAKGRLKDEALVATLFNSLRQQLKAAIAQEAHVMWRLRPTVEEKDVAEACPQCGHAKEPDYRVVVRCRMLASPEAYLVGQDTLYQDGQFVPLMGIPKS